MTRAVALLAAAIGLYEAYAVKSHRAPTITHLVHATRLHFMPPCPRCGVKVLGSRRPQYRGWHTGRVS